MGELLKLAEASGDSRHWTIEQMLEDALADIKSGKAKGTRAILLVLNDEGDSYDLVRWACNARPSELIALLESAKHDYVDALRGYGE